MSHSYRCWVEVSRAQIAANFLAVRQLVGSSVEVMPVVKADAYRHGAVEVSRVLLAEGARWLAVSSVEEGIEASKIAERNYKHTSIIHSHDVENMTAMARALDTTLFIKNGPCMAGLGLGGEGYLSYSIATPTGEGVTNPKTFCRVRRCVMVDNLRIY